LFGGEGVTCAKIDGNLLRSKEYNSIIHYLII
jgi:hypothetical protein